MQIIFICLICRHVSSIFIEKFRAYELQKYGTFDVHGVPRAKYETLLGGVQYFFICFLIGFICKEMLVIERNLLPLRLQICVLWVIVDLVTSFSTRLYMSMVYFLKIGMETKINIATLMKVQ